MHLQDKRFAYLVLREAFPSSQIYIVNKNLVIIDEDRYSLCRETQYYVIQNDKHRLVFDKQTLALQKAFRVLRGNLICCNL
jgi:hypothetical protein